MPTYMGANGQVSTATPYKQPKGINAQGSSTYPYGTPYPAGIDDLGSWLSSWMPNAANYYEQQFKNALESSNMMGGLAMGNYANGMNQLGNLNAWFAPQVMNARQQGLGYMQQGANAANGLLQQAIAQAQNAGKDLDFSKYMANIDSGGIDSSVDAMLKGVQANQFGLAEDAIARAAGKALKSSNQQMALRGLGGSTLANEASAGIAAQQAEQLRDASRQAANDYAANRLQYPYKQLEAAISAAQPGANAKLQAAGIMQNGAGTLGNLYQNMGQFTNSSMMDAYNSMMSNGRALADMPLQYFQMSQQLPNWAYKGRDGYLSSLLNAWQAKMQNDVANRNLDMQEEANEFNPIDIFF